MGIPSIEAVNLSKRFNSFLAVADLNLKIVGSKCVGFLGPNGSGKTTTLKMFTGLMWPTSGKALINGIEVCKHKKDALDSVGTLVEVPEIYPNLTPRECLMMMSKIRGIPAQERAKRIEETIATVRMEDWIDKQVRTFSKGMKQRICIASALLGDPTVLLLDEPTHGLDPRGMNDIRRIIKSLKVKGNLIFMSSHLLGEVTDICDEVAMIDHGKLLDYGTLSNIITKFSKGNNAVEVGLRGPVDNEVLQHKISSLSGVVTTEKLDDKKFKIIFNGGLGTQEEILASLVQMNIGVISYKQAWSELEDVYLQLIKEGN